MAITAYAYGNFLLKALNKEVDYDSDTIKVMLCTSSYTPNQDTHIYKSSVTNEIASGNGYTTGGVTLANKTIGYAAGTNVTKLDADDPSWTASTITSRYAVIYDDTPSGDSAKPLIAYIDFGADISSTASEFTIVFDAGGFITITVA